MVTLLEDVRSALEQKLLEPCFQPQVEFHSGKLTGFEVLARWRHPQLGLILPENFIALAEQGGLIGRLSELIFRKAFQAIAAQPEPLALAINISPLQLRDLTLPDQIAHIAHETGFPLGHLTVEITESALLVDLTRAQTIAHGIKSLGCRLALDDFGTGYSSLKHLQALPFDELKIDRSFVMNMASTRESRKIVAATIGLGHSLGLVTVAEGVETEEQADMLLWLGCERGQGWLYGRPAPCSEIAETVAKVRQANPLRLAAPGDGWAVSSLEALPTQRLAQLQAIYDGAPVGLCFLDRNLRYVSINLRLGEMNGAPVAAHLGKSVQEMAPTLFPAIEPYLLRVLKGESFPELEVVRPPHQPGDSQRTLRVSYQPAFDEADEVIGISIAVLDVTDQKRHELALGEREAHQEHMLQRNNQTPWIMDADGDTVEVSALWVRNTTLGKERVRHLEWLEALHPEDLEPAIRTIRAALRSGKPVDIVYRVLALDGDWRWMRSRGSPRFGPSGEITRWYGIVEDFEDWKLREQPQQTPSASLKFFPPNVLDPRPTSLPPESKTFPAPLAAAPAAVPLPPPEPRQTQP
jgi:PAS domain S-box-containing protein